MPMNDLRWFVMLLVWAGAIMLDMPSGRADAPQHVEGPIGLTTRTQSAGIKPLRYQWGTVNAPQYSSPVPGIRYSSAAPPCCGLPLGGLSTGCIDLDVEGVFGMSTIFSDHTLYSPNYQNGLWRGVPRSLPSYAPFLGLSVGGKTWVMASERMVRGGQMNACLEPALHKEDWTFKVPPLQGVAHAKEITYWGHYPIADVEYDTDAPVSIRLQAFSSFIPGDPESSNIPGAVFQVTLNNPSATRQVGTLAFTFPGFAEHEDRNATEFGHEPIHSDRFQGVWVTASADMPVEYALGVAGTSETVRLGGALQRDGAAWANIQRRLPESPSIRRNYQFDLQGEKTFMPTSAERGATVAVDFSLQPGESKAIPFVLAWYAPGWIGTDGLMYKHMYARRYGHFDDHGKWLGARAVAFELAEQYPKLLGRIERWQSVIYKRQNLPDWLRDSLINSFALFPETSYWIPGDANPFLQSLYGADGAFFGMMESPRGCPQIECIPCTWYGGIPVDYFFPQLAHSTLKAYQHFQTPEGEIPFTLGGWQVGRPYASQPGYFWQKSLNTTCFVHLVDRLWRSSGDRTVLEEFYPTVKKGMEYTMRMRPTPDGVISMPTANDGMEWFEAGEWAGMVAHIGGLRLAQCLMARRMAEQMNDPEFAKQCQTWFEQGSHAMETKLWTGNYYLNFLEEESGKRSDAIMAYQLDGQWSARFAGVQNLHPQERIATTLRTIAAANVRHAVCGAINFCQPNGQTYDSNLKLVTYGTHDMFPPEVLILAMTYLYAGDRETGLLLARRSLENIYCRNLYPWDQPNRVNGATGERVFGTDYYQNLIIWALPAAIEGQAIDQASATGSLVQEILAAGKQP
jgi:uncharacterized protein (DUF608 family)